MAPLIGLLALVCGLWFLLGMPAVAAAFAWEHRRNGGKRRGLLVAVVMLVVFHVSAILIWRMGTADWNLSFPATLEASVNSEKYGHPVEHRAEVMVVWLLLYSALAAAAAGAITAALIRPKGGRGPASVSTGPPAA